MPPPTDVLLGWYAGAARPLPWRSPTAGPWAVLVSEVMLQQTPVARVLPAHAAWLQRWPTPVALAAEPVGAAVRAWDRLGYPRRAVRLHAAAQRIAERHGGAVPASLPELLDLPGVGAYTARAVASFGFGQPHPVVDTNVRRVLHRALLGRPGGRGAANRADLALAGSVLAGRDRAAPRLSAALMELGALVCTARAPRCAECPWRPHCRWLAAGRPAAPAVPRPRYEGSDRQARGALLAVVRGSQRPVAPAALRRTWPQADQRERALAGLLADGLVVRTRGGVALP